MVDATDILDVAGSSVGLGGYYRMGPSGVEDTSCGFPNLSVRQFADPAEVRWLGFADDRAMDLCNPKEPETLLFSLIAGLELVPRLRIVGFVDQVREDLEDDIKDADTDLALPEIRRAMQTCLRFARKLAPHIALSSNLKFAAFVEEDGVVSLGIQSLTADRRINLEIHGASQRAEVHSIDEHMHSEHSILHVNNTRSIQELAEWVRKRV